MVMVNLWLIYGGVVTIGLTSPWFGQSPLFDDWMNLDDLEPTFWKAPAKIQ